MYYYEIALLSSPLEPLTYQSKSDINDGVQVEVKLKFRKKEQFGVVLKKVDKPKFKCTDITSVTKYFYDETMMVTASFISKYYICSLGEALSIYKPFYNIKKIAEVEILKSDIQLSSEQNRAYDFIQDNNTSLLFANTGSGKTEIYIKAIERSKELARQEKEEDSSETAGGDR